MSRRLIAVLVTAAALVSACSSSGGKPATKPVTGPTYTDAQATAGLLLASDLPDGYKRDPGYQHDSVPGGCKAVDDALTKEASLSPRFLVTSYRIADDSSSIDHEIELFASPAAAAAQYDRLIAALGTCKSWPLAAGTSSATISLTPSESGVLGERSTLLTLLVDAGQDKVGGKALFAVSGNAIFSLAESGSLGSDSDPRVDLRTLARKLLQRLRAQAG